MPHLPRRATSWRTRAHLVIGHDAVVDAVLDDALQPLEADDGGEVDDRPCRGRRRHPVERRSCGGASTSLQLVDGDARDLVVVAVLAVVKTRRPGMTGWSPHRSPAHSWLRTACGTDLEPRHPQVGRRGPRQAADDVDARPDPDPGTRLRSDVRSACRRHRGRGPATGRKPLPAAERGRTRTDRSCACHENDRNSTSGQGHVES